jgi:hypothetical protein
LGTSVARHREGGGFLWLRNLAESFQNAQPENREKLLEFSVRWLCRLVLDVLVSAVRIGFRELSGKLLKILPAILRQQV